MRIILLLMLIPAFTLGQNRINVTSSDVDMNAGFFQVVVGTPVAAHTFYRVVDGSAFFREEWSKGSAFLTKDKEYRNLRLKLDLLENQLHFQDNNGNQMICTTPIAGVVLIDSATGVPHQFRHTSFIPALSFLKPAAWVEVLADGKAQLYTQRKKNISETRPYGSATLEQRILTTDLHYVVMDDKMIKVKKLQDVVDALPDKKQEVQQWLGANKVEKNPQGFAKVITYYNSLN